MNKAISMCVVGIALSLAFTDASAQQQWQKLASFPGRQASSLVNQKYGGDWTRAIMDFNDDSFPDKAFGNPAQEGGGLWNSLTVVSGADPTQRWQIPLPNGIIAILIGFVDLRDGTSNTLKEIVMARKIGNRYLGPIILDSGGNTIYTFASNAVFVAAGDLNGDGIAEIIVADPAAMEVQIWGYQ